jgi:hypothetical protein
MMGHSANQLRKLDIVKDDNPEAYMQEQ